MHFQASPTEPAHRHEHHPVAGETKPHDHAFGQDAVRPGERLTFIVIGITALTMVVEIIAGIAFGSMALLADGLHMASHATALSLNAFAYVYARRHARDQRFTFGTGKVNALGGFAGAVLLLVFAVFMAGESAHRIVAPVPIEFTYAILVAVVGLLVNGICVVILSGKHSHGHDHNLRSAFLHVLADALTSVLAVFALLAGKFLGWQILDPLMGVVGALLVARWSVSLARDTSRVLLDMQAPSVVINAVSEAIEQHPDTTLVDVHIWSIGPGIYAAALTVAAARPMPAETYRDSLPQRLGIVHVNIEVVQRVTATQAGR
jgi:cation diffusion facilitator family transporter